LSNQHNYLAIQVRPDAEGNQFLPRWITATSRKLWTKIHLMDSKFLETHCNLQCHFCELLCWLWVGQNCSQYFGCLWTKVHPIKCMCVQMIIVHNVVYWPTYFLAFCVYSCKVVWNYAKILMLLNCQIFGRSPKFDPVL